MKQLAKRMVRGGIEPLDVSLLERCPHFRGCYVQASMELGPEDVERCPHFRGCYVQASMELGPEDVSLLERCPHFRGCYVQASMELGTEDMSLLERCPHFRGCYVHCTGVCFYCRKISKKCYYLSLLLWRPLTGHSGGGSYSSRTHYLSISLASN